MLSCIIHCNATFIAWKLIYTPGTNIQPEFSIFYVNSSWFFVFLNSCLYFVLLIYWCYHVPALIWNYFLLFSVAELDKLYHIALNGSEQEKSAAAKILCGASLVRGWNIQVPYFTPYDDLKSFQNVYIKFLIFFVDIV